MISTRVSQRRADTLKCQAMFAGAAWAAGANFSTLVTLANLDLSSYARRPGGLREAVRALTDPRCLAGDAWDETHLGTPDPSPTWIRYWMAGAQEEFRLSFENGRAGAARAVAV